MTGASGKLRRVIFIEKIASQEATEWSSQSAPPRYLPFARSMRLPSKDWQWRALGASAPGHEFVLFSRVNLRMGNYQAWLLHESAGQLSLLARLEDHASHEGLHVHSACGDVIPSSGTQSVNLMPSGEKLHRIPECGTVVRRNVQGWDASRFWLFARDMFRVRDPQRDQGELGL